MSNTTGMPELPLSQEMFLRYYSRAQAEDIRRDAYQAGRDAGLEEAAALMEAGDVGDWEYPGTAASAIRALKGKTP